MAWSNDAPGSRISDRTKRIVRTRDEGQCQLRYEGCDIRQGMEFDHIVNVKAMRIDRADADSPELIQLVCAPCHRKKTQAEALAGRNKWRRNPPAHPGLGR